MKPGWVAIAAARAATAPALGLACGACDEDKVAATYDHAVIDAAIARHRQVVFVAIDGPVDPQRIGTRLAAAAAKVSGIQPGTLRTSLPLPFRSCLTRRRRLRPPWHGCAGLSATPRQD